MTTKDNQKRLPLAFGVHHRPSDAPAKVLRQIESEAQALRVSIKAGKFKLAYIAACVGRHPAHISHMQSGTRAIPEELVGPLCAATGSNLLRQLRDLQEALEGMAEEREIERLAEMLRDAA